MNLNYSQLSGIITQDDNSVVAQGWAGNGAGKNNPAMQNVRNTGPLPQGVYQVGHWEEVHPSLGPMVAKLTQISGETFGRDAFYIHGPAKDPDKFGQESKGCIVIPREGRKCVKCLNPDTITVTP